MKATINIEVNPDHAKSMLRIAGFIVDDGKTEKEICEMAIRMNDCYGIKTKNIVWEDKTESEEIQDEDTN